MYFVTNICVIANILMSSRTVYGASDYKLLVWVVTVT